MASWSFEPIGVVQSCFAEKFGTPKQGRISPNSRAVIKLSEHLDAPAMLDGLQAFSHIWLLWVFHANSNRASLKKVRPLDWPERKREFLPAAALTDQTPSV